MLHCCKNHSIESFNVRFQKKREKSKRKLKTKSFAKQQTKKGRFANQTEI